MERIRPELKNEASTSLGDAPEEEYTFLLVPVGVYSLVSQVARREGCSVGEVFQRSLLQYLQAADSKGQSPPDRPRPDRPEPTITVRKRRSE